MFFVFTLMVVAMNVYDWWRLCRAFIGGHTFWSVTMLLVVLGLTVAPGLLMGMMRPSDLRGWLIQCCWIWLALSFMMACVFLVTDLWNLGENLLYIARRPSGTVLRLQIPPLWQGIAALAYMAVAVIWGLCEAHAIRVKEIVVESPKVPADVGDYRIALVSDLHLGPAANFARVRKTVRLVNECQADLVLSAGDLIDGFGRREQRMAEILRAFQCRSARKLAVEGNHDVYSGIDHSREMHRLADLELLEEAGTLLDGWLYVHGVLDPGHGGRPMPGQARHSSTLPVPPDGSFSLLLEHRPEQFPGQPVYDLSLSGHTHGG
ncbi:MAG: metallophosphoesterase, partial [Victivallales bacterium]|nr:metallophosphoesterase [Victivallales bacterium]